MYGLHVCVKYMGWHLGVWITVHSLVQAYHVGSCNLPQFYSIRFRYISMAASKEILVFA